MIFDSSSKKTVLDLFIFQTIWNWSSERSWLNVRFNISFLLNPVKYARRKRSSSLIQVILFFLLCASLKNFFTSSCERKEIFLFFINFQIGISQKSFFIYPEMKHRLKKLRSFCWWITCVLWERFIFFALFLPRRNSAVVKNSEYSIKSSSVISSRSRTFEYFTNKNSLKRLNAPLSIVIVFFEIFWTYNLYLKYFSVAISSYILNQKKI